jgi:hypothetical protein
LIEFHVVVSLVLKGLVRLDWANSLRSTTDAPSEAHSQRRMAEVSTARDARIKALKSVEHYPGIKADPDEFWEPMSEYELAEWRLGLLGAKAKARAVAGRCCPCGGRGRGGL